MEQKLGFTNKDIETNPLNIDTENLIGDL